MNGQRILALSSSRLGNGGYLEAAAPVIKSFLADRPQSIAFIPFASVDNDHKAYVAKVQQGLEGMVHTINGVEPGTAKEVLQKSDVIMTGGGNTFKLLHDLYELDLLELIKQKVLNGTPYIGWSAGSNITGLTICTTNDMPIIQPQSFAALGFFRFQINPHYYNVVAPGFNGETRDQRLEEFLLLNPRSTIICLPEGTALRLENKSLTFLGNTPGILMRRRNEELVREEISQHTDLSFLMHK